MVKVTFKTVQGKQFQLDVDEATKVAALASLLTLRLSQRPLMCTAPRPGASHAGQRWHAMTSRRRSVTCRRACSCPDCSTDDMIAVLCLLAGFRREVVHRGIAGRGLSCSQSSHHSPGQGESAAGRAGSHVPLLLRAARKTMHLRNCEVQILHACPCAPALDVAFDAAPFCIRRC